MKTTISVFRLALPVCLLTFTIALATLLALDFKLTAKQYIAPPAGHSSATLDQAVYTETLEAIINKLLREPQTLGSPSLCLRKAKDMTTADLVIPFEKRLLAPVTSDI